MSGIAPEVQTEALTTETLPLIGVTSVLTDRCPSCSAEMALDQRYCVECGVRRGAPRFGAGSASAAQAHTAATPPRQSPESNRKLLTALLVLMVLVALGVGVLLGRATVGTPNVYINAPGVTSGSRSSATSGSTASGSGGSSAKKSSSGSNSSRAGTKLGAKCKKGEAGCVNGKETGNFF